MTVLRVAVERWAFADDDADLATIIARVGRRVARAGVGRLTLRPHPVPGIRHLDGRAAAARRPS